MLHHSPTSDKLAALLAAAFAAAPISMAAAQAYTYTTIAVPNAMGEAAVAINASGTVLGSYLDANYVTHGFLYQAGTVTTFDDPAEVHGTYPTAMNDAGHVVGYWQDSNFVKHGFELAFTAKGKAVYKDVEQPGVTGTDPVAIGDGGAIYGSGTGSSQYVFLDRKGVFSTLIGTDSPTILGSSANGNLAGQYAGSYPYQGWVYAKGKLSTVLTGKKYPTAIAYGVNDTGVAVGLIESSQYVISGFMQYKNKLTVIAEPGQVGTTFVGINNSGTILGTAQDSSYNPTTFTYAGGTFTQVLVPGGSFDTTGIAINAAGAVIGTYYDPNFNQYVFLATPS